MWKYAIAAAAIVLIGTGCLKRVEVIAVLPDGAVSLVTQIEADLADAQTGDALPSAESGWQIDDKIETDDDGKQKIRRVARRQIQPNEQWPLSYAPPGSELESIAMMFPTRLTVEKRGDGTYYHFHRVYVGRAYSQIGYWRQHILETDEIKKISQQSPDVMTAEDRRALAMALIAFDTAKETELFDQAVTSVTANVAQDAILAARRALRAAYDSEAAVSQLAELFAEPNPGSELHAFEAQSRERATQGFTQALEHKHVSRAAINALTAAYADARRTFEITEDIEDEEWLVKIVMPGRIIEHNCFEQDEGKQIDLDQLAEDAEPQFQPVIAELAATHFDPGFSELDWTFDGEALYDRDIVVMATSFVPND